MNSKPNIVYILADDMGWGDLSCLNADSRVRTVNLDRLAAGGMVFRDAHATSAVCTPSRYGILTGRYNWRSWLKRGVVHGYSGPLLEPGRLTVASLLRENGYRTACLGKWHLGWTWPEKGRGDPPPVPASPGPEEIARWHLSAGSGAALAVDFRRPIAHGPLSAGFDYFLGISASLDMPPYAWVENDRVVTAPDCVIPARSGCWREGPIAPDFRHAEVLPRLAGEACAEIGRAAAAGKPFFLYLALPAPHTPILPGEEFRGRSGIGDYGDFCLEVDALAGRVADALEKHLLAENTVFIFTSDNGCSPVAGIEEMAAAGHRPSAHFRGLKGDIFEGGHRVPLIVRWPGRIRPGSVSDETVCLCDLPATCADILGRALADGEAEDSVSNLPAWEGRRLDRSLREATVHHSADGSLSLRSGRWKLEMCPGSGGWSRPRHGPDCAGLPPVQLYDLEADAGERRNLLREHPRVVEEMKELLTRYIRDGRSTPGAAQDNFGAAGGWEQTWWMNGAGE